MSVLALGITGHRHAASEEGDMPHVPGNGAIKVRVMTFMLYSNLREYYASAGVDAEYLHARKGRDDPHPEAEHVRDRGDGDGDAGLLVGRSQSRRHRVMDGGSPPSRQKHKSVVNPNSKHEEWCGKVDADEVHSKVHDTAKGRDAGQDGRDHTKETKHWLRLYPIRHHAGDYAEDNHDADVKGEVRNHRVCVLFKLLFKGEGGESVDNDVGEVLRLHGCKEQGLPGGATLNHPRLLGIQEVGEAEGLDRLNGVGEVTDGNSSEIHGERAVALVGGGVEPDRVGEIDLLLLDLVDEDAEVEHLVVPAVAVDPQGAHLLVVVLPALPLQGEVLHHLVKEVDLPPDVGSQQGPAICRCDQKPTESSSFR